MVNNLVAKRLGFDEEWKENTRWFKRLAAFQATCLVA